MLVWRRLAQGAVSFAINMCGSTSSQEEGCSLARVEEGKEQTGKQEEPVRTLQCLLCGAQAELVRAELVCRSCAHIPCVFIGEEDERQEEDECRALQEALSFKVKRARTAGAQKGGAVSTDPALWGGGTTTGGDGFGFSWDGKRGSYSGHSDSHLVMDLEGLRPPDEGE